MKNNPSISIALATFNGGSHLQEQLESLASQALLPKELVVSDDGSKDNTIDLLVEFSKISPFPVRLFINREQLGYGRNFLKAASMCLGSHVAFCDQDDIWLPKKLERINAALRDNDFDLIAHSAKVVDRHLSWLGANFPDIKFDRFLDESERSNGFFWPGFTLTISKALLSDVCSISGSAMKDLNFAHDELICELAINRLCYVISEPLALYRQHGNNLIGFHGAMLRNSNFQKTF